MAENNNSEKMFDTLTTWMDSTDAMNLTELRQVRRAMGDDVEKSERGFLADLAKLKAENPIPEAQRIEGLLIIAKRHGLDAAGLANQTGRGVDDLRRVEMNGPQTAVVKSTILGAEVVRTGTIGKMRVAKREK